MLSKPEVPFFLKTNKNPQLPPKLKQQLSFSKDDQAPSPALPITCMESNCLSPLSAQAGYTQGGIFCAFALTTTKRTSLAFILLVSVTDVELICGNAGCCQVAVQQILKVFYLGRGSSGE